MKYPNISIACNFFLLIFLIVSCNEQVEKIVRIPAQQINISQSSIIPIPASLAETNSSLAITPKTKIFVDTTSTDLHRVGEYLRDFLNDSIQIPTLPRDSVAWYFMLIIKSFIIFKNFSR